MANILIVEDEISIASGLENIIKSIDKDITTTVTGYAEQACNMADSDDFDLFLLDIELLDYSGLKLAGEIRRMEKYKLTPIIFITALPSKELLAFKEIHCYDYIVKPFKEETVRDAVNTILKYGVKKEKYISFNLKDFMYRIKMDDIIYFEAVQRKIEVVTIKERFQISGYTLNGLQEELTNNFIRCHRGYIVNTLYISRIDKVLNVLDLEYTDMKIPVGRSFKDSLGGAFNESFGD